MPDENEGFTSDTEAESIGLRTSEPAAETIAALQARIADYENAINWNTSCLACSRTLDASIADYERAERAEEAAAAKDQRIAELEAQALEPGQVAVTTAFLRVALHDAIRACQRDVDGGDPEAAGFAAEYQRVLAPLLEAQSVAAFRDAVGRVKAAGKAGTP